MANQNPNQTPSSGQTNQSGQRNTSFESDTQRSNQQQPSRSNESTGSGAGNVGTDQRSSSMPSGASQSERRSNDTELEENER